MRVLELRDVVTYLRSVGVDPDRQRWCPRCGEQVPHDHPQGEPCRWCDVEMAREREARERAWEVAL